MCWYHCSEFYSILCESQLSSQDTGAWTRRKRDPLTAVWVGNREKAVWAMILAAGIPSRDWRRATLCSPYLLLPENPEQWDRALHHWTWLLKGLGWVNRKLDIRDELEKLIQHLDGQSEICCKRILYLIIIKNIFLWDQDFTWLRTIMREKQEMTRA